MIDCNTFRLLGFFDGVELIVLTSRFAKKELSSKAGNLIAIERKRDY
jgi:hypothetical protein